jgi:hypothetical protein
MYIFRRLGWAVFPQVTIVGGSPLRPHLMRQDENFSVSSGMASDRGRRPVQCKSVDYGVS